MTLAVGGAAAGLGIVALSGLLTAMEAGIPVPPPSDLLILLLGEQASAGRVSFWIAFVALELVAVVGTTALFLGCRGPARALIAKVGPRVGLTEARMSRAAALVERRGRGALLVGRATPGLRTVTVVAAATAGIHPRRALPPLILGSSIFIQLHFVLGYLLGPVARELFEKAAPVAVVLALALIGGGTVFWLVRRGRRAGAQAAAEACCPACLGLGTLVPKVLRLEPLE